MAVKCNITSLVLERTKALNWGIKCVETNTFGIIENYLEYLNCNNVNYSICSEDAECETSILVFNCEFNVLRIGFTIEEDELIFKVNEGDYIGGTKDFVYLWAFDEEDFDLVSENAESAELILTLKPGKTLEALVSQVTVTVTDSNYCTSTKTCYITPEGMMCGTNYVACPNISELQVINKFVQCAGPMALSVTKKI